MFVLLATVSLIAGYVGGYKVDIQYRDCPDLKRIDLNQKFRFLFAFKWLSGRNVLSCALLIEIVGLTSALIILLTGISCIVFDQIKTGVLLSFVILMADGLIYFVISLCAGSIITKYRIRNGYFKGRNLICEIEELFRTTSTVKRKVKITGKESFKGIDVYTIRCGMLFKREYLAITTSKYAPQIGEVALAMYVSESTPHFILLRSYVKNRT